jgi:hypothetical protein
MNNDKSLPLHPFTLSISDSSQYQLKQAKASSKNYFSSYNQDYLPSCMAFRSWIKIVFIENTYMCEMSLWNSNTKAWKFSRFMTVVYTKPLETVRGN